MGDRFGYGRGARTTGKPPQHHGYTDWSHNSTLPQHHGYKDNSHQPITPEHFGGDNNGQNTAVPSKKEEVKK